MGRGRLPLPLPCLLSGALLWAPAAGTAATRTLAAPDPVALTELLPLAIGDRWLFGDQRQQPVGALMVSEAHPRGVRLDDESAERTLVLALDPARGLLMFETTALDGASETFEPPLALLPPRFEAGAVHRARSEVTETVDGEIARTGTRSLEAAIAAPEPIVTPAGEWLAWRVVTRITTDWAGEPADATTVEETWYAPAIGPVRRLLPSAGAARGRGERTEELLEAALGGRLIPP